jgi:hypothetical protein
MSKFDFRSLIRGIVHPASLIILAASAVAAEFINADFLVVGLILFLISAYLNGPRKAERARRIEELGLDMHDAPPGLKRWNVRLNEALQRVQGDLARLTPAQARFLSPVAGEVEALTGDIRHLLRQAYSLHRYLNSTNTAMLTSRAEHLDSQIAATADAYSKQQLQEAATAMRHQLDNCEQIRVLIGRTEATLENMQASLDAIGSSIVRMAAGEMSDENMARQESLQRLSSARGTVAALEEVIKGVELA